MARDSRQGYQVLESVEVRSKGLDQRIDATSIEDSQQTRFKTSVLSVK